MGQIAFLFGGLLGEDMAFESVFSLNLTRTGESEAFLRSRDGFHFRHNRKISLNSGTKITLFSYCAKSTQSTAMPVIA